MLSYSQSLSLFQKLTNNVESGNTTFFNLIFNEKLRTVLGNKAWPFLEKSRTGVTVASQQSYYLPADCKKLINVYVTSGTTNYIPKECPDRKFWDELNKTTQTSDVVEWFTIIDKKIYFYPTPATSDLVITYRFTKKQKDLTIADLTTSTVATATYPLTFTAIFAGTESTGTLSNVWALATGTYRLTFSSGEIRTAVLTNASAAVTFSSALTEAATATVTFSSTEGGSIMILSAGVLARHVGFYLRLTDGTADKTGDGEWYEIATATPATTIILTSPYNGIAIATGTAACTIAQVSLLPEDYHIIPVYESIADYWNKESNVNLGSYYQKKADDLKAQMFEEYFGLTDDVVIESKDYPIINPNLTNITIT